MSNDQDNLATSLLDGVKRIDEFRTATNASGNGTDLDAAWELIEDMRETFSRALKTLGVEVAPYVDEEAPAPGPR